MVKGSYWLLRQFPTSGQMPLPDAYREIYQLLKDVALGTRVMKRACKQSWSEIYHGLMPVEIDDCHLTFFNDRDTLDYCEYCTSRDGRVGSLGTWQRYGF